MQFSALWKQCWRKYQPSKTAKLLGGKKLMSHTFFVKFQVFKRNFSETIWYIGLKFSEISVMLFQFSETVLFISFIIWWWAYVNEAKKVNKDLPIPPNSFRNKRLADNKLSSKLTFQSLLVLIHIMVWQ